MLWISQFIYQFSNVRNFIFVHLPYDDEKLEKVTRQPIPIFNKNKKYVVPNIYNSNIACCLVCSIIIIIHRDFGSKDRRTIIMTLNVFFRMILLSISTYDLLSFFSNPSVEHMLFNRVLIWLCIIFFVFRYLSSCLHELFKTLFHLFFFFIRF